MYLFYTCGCINVHRFNQHVNYMYCDTAASVLRSQIPIPMTSAKIGIPPAIILECYEGVLNAMSDLTHYLHTYTVCYTVRISLSLSPFLSFPQRDYMNFTAPSRRRHNCLPSIVIPLIIYSDDTSGNRSKKWNKFDYWCLLLAGLPDMKTRSCPIYTSLGVLIKLIASK